jgi:transposase
LACESARCAQESPSPFRPLIFAGLEAQVQDRNASQKCVWRTEIVLLTAGGVDTNEIMRRTGKSKTCVWRWQERFMEEGFDGLLRDKTRPSRIKPLGAEAAERVVAFTLSEPLGETTHWTGALMAKAAGLSVSSVQRIWRAHDLQPHRMRQFKLSNDPRFVDKLRDVVGLYVDPPAHAMVLSVDEKSQIQALDRTQPGLPLKKGRAGTMTHDYERHGSTTLFAAMNALDGTVIGRNMQRHRHQSSFASSMSLRSRFSRERRSTPLSTTTPPTSIPMFDDGSNAILDGRSISRRRRPPDSAVEGFFATLTKRRLKRGVFRSVADLQAVINRFLEDHNQQSKPFIWTADPDKIIAAVRRGHQVLDSIH